MIKITLLLFYCLNIIINRQLNKYTLKNYCHAIEVEKWFSSIFGTRYFLIKIIRRQKQNWFTGKFWYTGSQKQGKYNKFINF